MKTLTIIALAVFCLHANASNKVAAKYSVHSRLTEKQTEKTTETPGRKPSSDYSNKLFEANVTSNSSYVDKFHFFLVLNLSSNQEIRGMEIHENYDYNNYKANASLDPSEDMGSKAYNSTYFGLDEFKDGVSLLDLPSFIPLKDPIVIQTDANFSKTTGGKVYVHFLYKIKGVIFSDYRTITLNIEKAYSKFRAKCLMPTGASVSFNHLDVTIRSAANLPSGVSGLDIKQDKINMGTIDIDKLPK